MVTFTPSPVRATSATLLAAAFDVTESLAVAITRIGHRGHALRALPRP